MTTKSFYATLLIICFLFTGACATEYIATGSQSFRPDTIYEDDIFMAGNYIRFQSDIVGDLNGASQELVFSGRGDGNINWAARWITINGPVSRSVRAFAQIIDINAPLGKNLLAMGQSITVGPECEIQKDATIFGDEVTMEGSTGGELLIGADRVIIAGRVGGNLTLTAQQLEIKPTTVIQGDLDYKSPEKVKIEDNVVINGQIKWTEYHKETKQKTYNAFGPIKFITMMYLIINIALSATVFLVTLFLGNTLMIPLIFIAFIIGALVIVALNRQLSIRAMTTIKKRFLVCLGLGILLLLLFPVAALLAILTLVGIPLGLIIVFAFGIFCFAGAMYSAHFVGFHIIRLLKISKEPPCFLCIFTGIIILAGLILIPYIGWIITLLALSIGLGAMVLSLEKFQRKQWNLKQAEASPGQPESG
jgi:cytoskeletal protein CcmA (bactofilin family)